MTDNLKQRIAKAIKAEIASQLDLNGDWFSELSDGNVGVDGTLYVEAISQAVLDIVEPMLRQREQHIQALILKQYESHGVIPLQPAKE